MDQEQEVAARALALHQKMEADARWLEVFVAHLVAYRHTMEQLRAALPEVQQEISTLLESARVLARDALHESVPLEDRHWVLTEFDNLPTWLDLQSGEDE